MLAIFDMSSVNIERYNKSLLMNFDKKILCLVDDPELFYDIPNQPSMVVGGFSITRLAEVFLENKISCLLVSGQRCADIRVFVAANKVNIPIVYKMHGLHVPYMERNFSFYFKKLNKAIRTLYYLVDVCFETKTVKLAFGVFCSFVFGRSRRWWANDHVFQVDSCMVWSEYWINWHERYWYMRPSRGWTVLGNPDSTNFQRVPVFVC